MRGRISLTLGGAADHPLNGAGAAQRGASALIALLMHCTSQAADFRSLSDSELLQKASLLKQDLASVRFLQRTRGIAEVKPGEQQNPDPEKVSARGAGGMRGWDIERNEV